MDAAAVEQEAAALRVGTWNLNGRTRGDRAGLRDAVQSQALDVLLLQEVRPSAFKEFAADFDDAAFSLDLERKDGETNGRHGCAILVRGPVRLLDDGVDLVYRLPQPERGLVARASWGNHRLDLLSWHSANAAQHGPQVKDQAYRAIIDVLAGWGDTGVAGMDTNFPSDPVDLQAADEAETRPEWRFHFDLLGPSPQHDLVDAARALLEREPSSLGVIPAAGPLAKTYRAGVHDVRFDRLLVTRDIRVAAIEHLYDEVVPAYSDHALLVAALTIG